MPDHTITGNVLGFDFGLKHIGVALGNTAIIYARPLTRLKATDGIPEWEQIEQLILKWEVKALIIGKPLQLDGSTQEIYFAAKKFSQKLHGRYQLPVFFIDERYTTKEARILSEGNIEYDSLAAKLIIESWLRENQST